MISPVSQSNGPRLQLRAIVYQEGPQWIAHCLELDIVAEGSTPDDAMRDLIDLCEFQIGTALENDNLESVFRPAPAQFWKLYFSRDARKRKLVRKPNPPVERFDARELVLG